MVTTKLHMNMKLMWNMCAEWLVVADGDNMMSICCRQETVYKTQRMHQRISLCNTTSDHSTLGGSLNTKVLVGILS